MIIKVKPDGWSEDEWKMLSDREKNDYIAKFTWECQANRRDVAMYREIALVRLELGGPAPEEDVT